jgi:hypothetical protein
MLVAPVNGDYRPVLEINSEEDNSGSCNPPRCYQNKALIRLVPTHRAMPDIELDRTGTRESSGAVISASERILYTFNGSKYVISTVPRESEEQ